MVASDVKSLKLASHGKLRIEWSKRDMPVLSLIEERFKKSKPLKGQTISCCLHITTETANLLLALKAGGAKVIACASNPLSTQDDVAASLVKDYGLSVFAIKGESAKVYYSHIKSALDVRPTITMDDGADLVCEILSKRKELVQGLIGSTEETTTGVIRLKAMADQGVLAFPVVAVNDALTKHMFDNRYGTGQSTMDGIIRATNTLIAGRIFVVCGYGWCGHGVALRAKGLGADVVVTEVDPLRALEAIMDGFRVMPIADAAKIGDIFVTVTGNTDVIRKEHFLKMKDGALVCNSGHFNVELELKGLSAVTKTKRVVRDFVDEYKMKNGNRIYIIADGRLVNLSAAEGHPACVMDMSFANQALAAEYLAKNHTTLGNKVYPVPENIDKQIATMKLKSLGVKIDRLTEIQKKYLASWEFGT
ncbi:adenosylhomocysteinase [PVC group bacterium]|nr:adenosylhomocysteinase [PVC group bacterium]